MAVEAVDAHLGETAVLAIVLDADARLEVEAVGKRACADAVENLAGDNAHERRALTALDFAFGGCHDHLVEHEGVGLHIEVGLDALAGFDADLHRFGLVAGEGCLEGVFAGGEVAEDVVARGVGECGKFGAEHLDEVVGHVLAGFGVNYVSTDVGVRHFCMGGDCKG